MRCACCHLQRKAAKTHEHCVTSASRALCQLPWATAAYCQPGSVMLSVVRNCCACSCYPASSRLDLRASSGGDLCRVETATGSLKQRTLNPDEGAYHFDVLHMYTTAHVMPGTCGTAVHGAATVTHPFSVTFGAAPIVQWLRSTEMVTRLTRSTVPLQTHHISRHSLLRLTVV